MINRLNVIEHPIFYFLNYSKYFHNISMKIFSATINHIGYIKNMRLYKYFVISNS